MKLKKIICNVLLVSMSFMFVACNSGSSSSNSSINNKSISNFYKTATGPLAKYSSQFGSLTNLTKICVVNGSLNEQRTATFSDSSKIPPMNLLPGEVKCALFNGQNGIAVWNDYNSKDSNVRFTFSSAHPSGSPLVQALLMFFNMAVGFISASWAEDPVALFLGLLPPSVSSAYSTLTSPFNVGLKDLAGYGALSLYHELSGLYNSYIANGQLLEMVAVLILNNSSTATLGDSNISMNDWMSVAKNITSYDQLNSTFNKEIADEQIVEDFKKAQSDEAQQYIAQLSSAKPSGDAPDAIAGTLYRANDPDINTHIAVLSFNPAAKGSDNPFYWGPGLVGIGDGGGGGETCNDLWAHQGSPFSSLNLFSSCDYDIDMLTLNIHSQIISQDHEKIYSNGNTDVTNSAPMDGIYLCLLDDTNKDGHNNCSMNDLNAPLDYSEPLATESGVLLSGTIKVTNNTSAPLAPILQLYTGSSSTVESTVAGGLLPPGGSYTFTPNQIGANVTAYRLFGDSSVWGGTPNTLQLTYNNHYGATEAEQRVVINYDFASGRQVGNAQGPFQAYTYDPTKLSDPHGDLWDSHAVRAWQQIRLAQSIQNTSSSNASSPKIQVWVPNWKGLTYSAINDIDVRADDIMFAFVNVGTDGSISSSNTWGDYAMQGNGLQGGGLVAALLALGKPVYIGVGGWNNSDNFTSALRNVSPTVIAQNIQNNIASFENDAAIMGVTQRIAGVDLDWEPNNGHWTMGSLDDSSTITLKDLQAFMALVDALNSHGIIVSASISQNLAVLKSVDDVWKSAGNTDGFWKTLANKTLGIKPMTYDYHAATWGVGPDESAGYTNFNSPLHYSPNQKIVGDFATYNVESSMNYFLKDGIPASKLTVGQTTYGYAWPATAGNYGAYIPFDNDRVADMIGLEIPDSSIISYKAIYYNSIHDKLWFDYNNKISWAIDPDAEEGYTQGSLQGGKSGNVWVSFENHDTAKARMQYTKANGFYSVMVWEIDQDLPSLMSTIKTPNPNSIMSGLVDGAK